MEIYELNALVKVVQAGSFTQAAEALGTQKAHLSRTISQLESRLGVRLLERTTRSLSLTEVGRELFERAMAILAAVDDAERAVQHTQGEPRGVLKLTCGVEFGQLAVSAWINTYLQSHPQVSVEADWSNRVVDLVHEGFDLAIRLGDLPDSSLAARKLGEVHYGFFAASVYLQQHGEPVHADELAQHSLLMFTGGILKQGWVLRRGDETVRVPAQHGRYRINNNFAVCDAARAGLGIARLPRLLAHNAVATGALKQVLCDWTTPSVLVHAVFPSARFLAPKVRAFIDIATHAF